MQENCEGRVRICVVQLWCPPCESSQASMRPRRMRSFTAARRPPARVARTCATRSSEPARFFEPARSSTPGYPALWCERLCD